MISLGSGGLIQNLGCRDVAQRHQEQRRSYHQQQKYERSGSDPLAPFGAYCLRDPHGAPFFPSGTGVAHRHFGPNPSMPAHEYPCVDSLAVFAISLKLPLAKVNDRNVTTKSSIAIAEITTVPLSRPMAISFLPTVLSQGRGIGQIIS